MTWIWQSRGQLKREMESFLTAKQNNFKKDHLYQGVNSSYATE